MKPPLAGLTRRSLATELTAGVTLLAIAIPLNIGYAQIAGLPATAGLYALVVPTVVYALVVSSRQLVASPDAAAAALVASSIGGLAAAGSADYATLALAQAIICGVMFLLLAVFKLGFLANFLSKPILVGFLAGLAVDIMISQIAKMLGVTIDSGDGFLAKVAELATGLGTVSGWSVLISVGAVIVLLFGRRLWHRVPWALVVLVVATAAVMLTGLDQHGVDVLGEVPAGIPLPSWPIMPWSDWLALVPSSIAITFVTIASGLLVARSYAERRGYEDQPDRDLLALGLANIAAGAQSSFAVSASPSRTAAMDQSGSRTQLPSIVLAAGTLLLLLFGTALLAGIPSPVIGAIVSVAIIPLLGIRDFMTLWRQDRFEFTIGAVCFLVTLLIGSIAGIIVAFLLAVINLVRRAASPAIDILESSGDPGESLLEDAPQGSTTAPGVIVIRLAAPLFFANGPVFSNAVKNAVAAAGAGATRHVVIDMEAVTDVDVTGAEAFDSLTEWLDDQNVGLAFSRVRPPVLHRLQRLGVLTDQTVYPTNRSAIAALSESPEKEES